MASKIYVVTAADGTRSLVRAKSPSAAERFKRATHVYTAHLAKQADMLELVGVVPVEDATDAALADLAD